jgi:hypothetical protein
MTAFCVEAQCRLGTAPKLLVTVKNPASNTVVPVKHAAEPVPAGALFPLTSRFSNTTAQLWKLKPPPPLTLTA